MRRLMQVGLTILFTLSLVVASLVGCRPPVAAPLENTRALTGQLSGDIRVGGGLTVDDNASVGGALAVTGDTTLTGALGVTGAVTLADGIAADYAILTAPTAQGTATPALLVNNLGVSNPLEVQDGGTPVVQAFNGGGVKVAAPTAIATAVPAFYVDSLGVSNIFEVRDAQTPVAYVANGGAAVFSSSITGASAAIGGGYASSGCDLSSAGVLQCSGGGDWNGGTVNINASSNNGVNINTGSSTGALALGGGLGTVAVNSSDWDIGATGDATGLGSVAMDGAVTQTQVNAANGSANPWDYTGTLGIMDNSDNFTLFDVNITNANHAGSSNYVYAMDVAGITQDDQATETAILIGAGWDNALDLDGNNVVLGADGGVTLDESSDDVVAVTMGAAAGTFSVLTGNLNVGNAAPTQSQATGENMHVEGMFEVDSTSYLEGTAQFGGGYGDAGCTISDAGVVQCDSSGTFASLTTGDITAATGLTGGFDIASAAAAANTAGQTTDIVGQAGGASSGDADGRAGGAVSITAGAGTALSGAGTNDGSGGDLVLLGGAKGGATGTGADGMVKVGAPTVGNATGTNSLAVAGALEVDGNVYADDGFNVTGGTSTFAGAVNISAADVTLSAAGDGNNAGARNEFIGLPRIRFVGFGAGTNPGAETVNHMDDDPNGEYAPIDGTVTEALSNTYYRYGAASYQASFLDTAIDGSGFKATVGSQSLEDEESVGLWIYPSEAITSGVLQLLLTDDNGAREYDLPALTASTWNWAEVNITALNGGTGDAITEVGILMTDAGADAKGAFTIYVDQIWSWDAEDEDEILVGGASVVLQRDGVLGVVDPADGTNLAEGTNYIVHYEAAKTYLVWITDESAAYDLAMVAY